MIDKSREMKALLCELLFYLRCSHLSLHPLAGLAREFLALIRLMEPIENENERK